MAQTIVPATSVRKKRLAVLEQVETDDAAVRKEMAAAIRRMIDNAIGKHPDCPSHVSCWVDRLNQCLESLQDPS